MLYRDYIQLKQYFFAFLHLSIISSSKCYVAWARCNLNVSHRLLVFFPEFLNVVLLAEDVLDGTVE